MDTKQSESLVAYEAHQNQIKKLLAQIGTGLENHDRNASQDRNGHHWGHVGDLADIELTLTDIRDRLYGTGEYAPVPTYKVINGKGKTIKVTVPER